LVMRVFVDGRAQYALLAVRLVGWVGGSMPYLC